MYIVCSLVVYVYISVYLYISVIIVINNCVIINSFSYLNNNNNINGVHQGDPLGSLLFSLVLHKLIRTVIEDTECSQLLLNSWYLDDGVLSGTKSVICRAVTLIQRLGPVLGLCINPAKCELFSRTVLSDFPKK